VDRCKKCNAVINPRWSECFVCGNSLNETVENTLGQQEIENIKNMNLNDFSKTSMAIKINSPHYGIFYFVSNKEALKKLKEQEGNSLVVYLPNELKHILKAGLETEQIEAIHKTKGLFPLSRVIGSKTIH
jgi:hypothetical protein